MKCCKSVIGGNCNDCPYVCCNMYADSDAIKDAIDRITRQEAEIESLKLECGLAKFDKYKAEFEEFRAEIKAEAIKEFAEMVVADCPEMEFYLHNLVKEEVGEGE